MASESFHQQEEKSSVVDALLRLNNGSSRNNINVNGEEQPFINPWEAAADEHFQSYDDDGDDGVPQRQQPPAVWPGSVESYWREGDAMVVASVQSNEPHSLQMVNGGAPVMGSLEEEPLSSSFAHQPWQNVLGNSNDNGHCAVSSFEPMSTETTTTLSALVDSMGTLSVLREPPPPIPASSLESFRESMNNNINARAPPQAVEQQPPICTQREQQPSPVVQRLLEQMVQQQQEEDFHRPPPLPPPPPPPPQQPSRAQQLVELLEQQPPSRVEQLLRDLLRQQQDSQPQQRAAAAAPPAAAAAPTARPPLDAGQRSDISDPNPRTDVIFGPGGHAQHSPPARRFRAIVDACYDEYNAECAKKKAIKERLTTRIYDNKELGLNVRFLGSEKLEDGDSKRYFLLDRARVYHKIDQRFRTKTKEIRAAAAARIASS